MSVVFVALYCIQLVVKMGRSLVVSYATSMVIGEVLKE